MVHLKSRSRMGVGFVKWDYCGKILVYQTNDLVSRWEPFQAKDYGGINISPILCSALTQSKTEQGLQRVSVIGSFCSFIRLEEYQVPVATFTRQKMGTGNGVMMKWMKRVKREKLLFPKKRWLLKITCLLCLSLGKHSLFGYFGMQIVTVDACLPVTKSKRRGEYRGK